MTRYDIFDQPVTLTDPDAVDAWDKMCMAFLAHGATTPVHLGKLLEKAPDYAAAYSVKGLFYVLLGRLELMDEARSAKINCCSLLESWPQTVRWLSINCVGMARPLG